MVDDPGLIFPRYCEHGKLCDDECDECYREETGHYPQCGVYEGTQRGPCTCSSDNGRGDAGG